MFRVVRCLDGQPRLLTARVGPLSIFAGEDPNNALGLVGGQFNLGSTIEGYSGTSGGSLTILAPLIQLGGTAGEGVEAIDPGNTLFLSPGFFDQGGFSSFTLKGLGEVAPNQPDPNDFLPAISVPAGVTIDPVAQQWVAGSTGSTLTLTATTLPLPSQRKAATLNLSALGVSGPGGLVVRGDVEVGAGATLETDPTGTISISASTVDLEGSLVAPGGSISIAGAKNSGGLLFADTTDPLVTVNLGSNSVVSTAGVVELTPNAYGLTTGTVLPGGTINISGNILAQSGAVLDVEGTSGLLDVQTNSSLVARNLLPSPYSLTTESSNGGTISLTGGEELFTDATLLGGGGGSSAEGGSLSITSGIYSLPSATGPSTPLDANLVITQGGPTFVAPSSGGSAIGAIIDPTRLLDNVDGNPIYAYFDADPNIFASAASGVGNGGRAGGFDALTLSGTDEFSGSVSIATNRSIAAGGGGVLLLDSSIPNSTVTLTAPYITLGIPFQGPQTLVQQQQNPIFEDANGDGVDISPTYAAGQTLSVNASVLTDVGNLSLQNIGELNFSTTAANTPSGSIVAGTPVHITGSGEVEATVAGYITAEDGSETAFAANTQVTVASGTTITLDQAGTITPNASGIIPATVAGDIRGDGTLDVAGAINLNAAQIYPTTETTFAIGAYDIPGQTGSSSISITAPIDSALPALPLSGGGTLDVFASVINQGGRSACAHRHNKSREWRDGIASDRCTFGCELRCDG
jgi:filamentous hemagglutinin